MPSLEEALLTALEEERKLSEERALLPGLLQHDLSNVLCQVTLATSLIAMTADEADRARQMRDLQGGVKRMNELLSGMKFLFQARGSPGDFQRGDLATFVAKLVHEPGVWPPGSPVTLELPHAAVCTFSPTLMRHSLVNLIGNAVAYSRETWVRVRLSRTCDAWQVSVANGGPGIPVNYLPYLFELAPTAHFAEKSSRGGGLGLYIARMCVRWHGATLRLRAREKITAFAFAVPDASNTSAELPERGGFAA